ncbi:ChaN family lipoprotein [Neptunomonas japonica]|uniref:ChaN family lipoprotein n=1 Tax=Neptunomonas japonica TaxID=417574 RepID=UPI00146A6D4B|nr:ChaN family lipoprotein [Neptunomonas japonica]
MLKKTTKTHLFQCVAFFLFLTPLFSQANSEWSAPLLQNHSLVGKIYSLDDKAFITEKALITDLQKSRYVLIGEKHDNEDHHRLELQLLESLLNKPHTHVVFEMLTDKQQSKIALLTPTDSKSQIHTKLAWNDKSWPWKDYAPLIQRSLSKGANISAGNINRATIKQIYQQKNNDTLFNETPFKTLKNIPEVAKKQILNQVFESHCQLMSKAKLAPMMTIQLARDASMSNAMLTNQEPTILIAGSFHTQKNMGVPLHLRQVTKQTTKTVLLAEVRTNQSQPEDYVSLSEADYIWFTPKQVDKDYCESLREKHKP